MPSPFQAATAAATTGLAYSSERKLEQLCDGSYLLLYQSAVGTLSLKQITNPSATPTFTAVSQTFSVASGSNTTGDIFVLNNGTTTSDVWVVWSDNSATTGLFVAHGTYTASGSTWSWDNTSTSIALGALAGGFMLPSIVWTGSTLIVASRCSSTNWSVCIGYTTTKNGSAGWVALAELESEVASSHCYPQLRHDAANACTLIVYSMGGDTVYVRVLADSSTPAIANWSARTALTGTVNVGADNIASVLDTANKRLHVAYIDAGLATNPQYVNVTYTASTIGTPSSVLAADSGATTATGASIGLDSASPPDAYLFWASGAVGSASDINYLKIASPYTSAGATTNLTNNTANDNAYPHVPTSTQMSGYIPLVYAHAVSPWPIEYDNSITLSGGSVALPSISGALVATLGGALTPPAVALPVASGALVATLKGERYLAGTGIGDIAVTTKSQSWSGGPSGSPGTETDVSYQDALGGGWTSGLIPTYGADTSSSWYERDGGVDGANQTSLATAQPDGHLHWLEQNGVGAFAGSEDAAYTLTELAPTGTVYRRYYRGTWGPDANGFNWAVYTCYYPGDPGIWAYRFDLINPSVSPIALAASDSLEIALLAGLEQSDSTWAPTNGGYGIVGGANTAGWPSALTSVDPDYVYITPSGASGLNLGQATLKQKATSAYSPAWASAQIQYLQNATRLKLKVQGTLASFPASTTSTVYLLNVQRRNLTSADVAAMAADYQAPGTPTMSVGSFSSFSYDEAAYVMTAASNAVTSTLDFTPAHVTVRYKPRYVINGWTATGVPSAVFNGIVLTNNQDFRYYIDTTNHILYFQLYWDVVASGAGYGQLNNGALVLSAPSLALPLASGGLTATLGGVLTPPAVALASVSGALVATLGGALTPPAVALPAASGALAATLAGALTPPGVALASMSGALTATLGGLLTPPAVALPLTSGALAATLAGALTPSVALPLARGGLTAALSGQAQTALTATVTGVVFLPNVLLSVARAVYDSATHSTGGYRAYLANVLCHLEPSTQRDYIAMRDGALVADYTASVASGADIASGDRITAITQLDGTTPWPNENTAGSEYYEVIRAIEDLSTFLPQHVLALKRVTGGGPAHR